MNEQTEKRFVVVAIRHFENGEHHWFAPDGRGDFEDDPKAFGGSDTLNDCGKPLFTKVDDAANWAMAMVHGAWRLDQWEFKRPTFVIITDDEWTKLILDSEYTYPKGSEEWSDEQVADWERADDIRWMMRVCQWDSDSDCEHPNSFVRRVNDCEGLTAWLEDNGTIAVHYHGEVKDEDNLPTLIALTDGFPLELQWTGEPSDYAHQIAWFKVVEG